MEKTILLLKQEFDSSAGLTDEFAQFSRTFKREFRSLLKKEFAATKVEMNRGHFEISGFFQLPNNNIYYFNMGDVRWFKSRMLLRTAKSFTDYTGGRNNDVPTDNKARFIRELKRLVR